MKYLTKKQIVALNKATVAQHGGNFIEPSNFFHEENLDYLIEAVSAEMFGHEMYPSIVDKAALYCYNIICNHIFSDGNKRTGLISALIFLNLNGKDLGLELDDELLTAFILKISSGESSLHEVKAFFDQYIVDLHE